MAIPSEIESLIERLQQNLNQIDQETNEGLTLVGQLLSRFTNNAVLIQYFGYFSTILFFVETSKRQVDAIVSNLATEYVTVEFIQEAGEELGTLLGQVLEVKINISRVKTRLENWP